MRDREHTELGQFGVDPRAADLLPEAFCRERSVVILGPIPRERARPIVVGALRPGEEALRSDLERELGRCVRLVQLNDYEVGRALDGIYRPEAAASDAPLALGAARRIRFEPGQAPAEMVDDFLSEAVRVGASDVHIEVFRDDVDLRFRIDGVLRQTTTPVSPANVVRVISRIKVLAELDLVERRVAQDGRITATYRDGDRIRPLHIRVAVIPGLYGEEVVLRLLDPNAFLLDLAALGMQPHVLAAYERLIRYPQGLLLVSGPTCSGKTTTLYATIQRINTPENKILTAEDPVEYEFAKVSQKNVSPQMSFAAHVRAFLRQNPDIILIGEIRDEETAEQAVRAANTGHLVLSSIHTADAISGISRLRALGIDDDYLSEVLIGVLAQRLVRKLCPDCRTAEEPDPELVRRFYRERPGHAFLGPRGCARCGEGHRGRIGVFELFRLTEGNRAMIAQGKSVNEILRAAREQGYETIAQDALGKVQDGTTSLAEVARVLNPSCL